MAKLNSMRAAAFGLDEFLRLKDSQQPTYLPRLLFLSTFVFYSAYLLILQPSILLGGEMWAEMATNYFPNSTHATFLQRIISLDAGYVPLPQRIIALLGAYIRTPAAAIPFLYAWSAVFITAGLVGVFCLAPFRKLIANDYLRFLVVLTVLIVADFETRSFINFTYFGAFFIAILSALAFVENERDVPAWAWFAPIIIVSKPAVLAILPIMICAAIFSKNRFRVISVVCVAFGIAQILRLAISKSEGTFAFAFENDFTTLDKVFSTVKNFIGLVGVFFVGKGITLTANIYMLIGLLILIAMIAMLVRRRSSAMALVVVGLSLIFFNCLLNSFALSWEWNTRMEQLPGLTIGRHIVVAYSGGILAIVGLYEAFVGPYLVRRVFGQRIAVTIFIIWLALSGWIQFGSSISREFNAPALNNSSWQSMARILDSSEPVCVPVDPLGWVYGRNCARLNNDLNWGAVLRYKAAEHQVGDNWFIDIQIPATVQHKELLSFSIYARTEPQSVLVTAYAELLMRDGRSITLSADKNLDLNGGGIFFANRSFVRLDEVKSMRVHFNLPIQIAYVGEGLEEHPAILWMGR